MLGGSNVPFPLRPNTEKYLHTRGCTDLPCLICYLVAIAVWATILVFTFRNGDPQRLVHGLDYQGKLCGFDAGVENLRYTYWCGSETRVGDFPKSIEMRSTACVETCPQDTTKAITCLQPPVHKFMVFGPQQAKGVTYPKTLQMAATQSLMNQSSYPTEEYGGHYCVPQWRADNTLQADVIKHRLSGVRRWSISVGSFFSAWWVILIGGAFAILVGYLVLFLLSKVAGFYIFLVECLTTILLLGHGLWFLFAIFVFNPDDHDGTIQKGNPFWRALADGSKAKLYSLTWGFILVVLGIFAGLITKKTFHTVDRSIGVIEAATNAYMWKCCGKQSQGVFWLFVWPIVDSAVKISLYLFMFWGLMRVCSYGEMSASDYWFNNKPVDGLRIFFSYDWYQKYMIIAYVFVATWIILWWMSASQFIVAYIVCDWWFEATVSPVQGHGILSGSANVVKYGQTRIVGADGNTDSRPYAVVRDGEKKFIIAEMGRKSPGGHVEVPGQHPHFFKDTSKMTSCVICPALMAAFKHAGTLACGCWPVAICSVFRFIEKCLTAWTSKPEEEEEDEQDDESFSGKCNACCGVLALFMDSIFGMCSKTAFTVTVLDAKPFSEAALDAYEHIGGAGGIVSLLHGSTYIFEFFSTVALTFVTTIGVYIIFSLDNFTEPDSDGYVADPIAMCMLMGLIAFTIGSSFMLVFGHTADTMIYCFSWNREHQGDIQGLIDKGQIAGGPSEKDKYDLEKTVPQAMRNLVHHEMESAPALGGGGGESGTSNVFSSMVGNLTGRNPRMLTLQTQAGATFTKAGQHATGMFSRAGQSVAPYRERAGGYFGQQ